MRYLQGLKFSGTICMEFHYFIQIFFSVQHGQNIKNSKILAFPVTLWFIFFTIAFNDCSKTSLLNKFLGFR